MLTHKQEHGCYEYEADAGTLNILSCCKQFLTNCYFSQEGQKKILKDATCKFWAGAL